MSKLFRLYNDIFSTLPVSLVGYDKVNKEINSFFYKLINNSYFREYKHISFFSYSLSKLKEASTWETDILSHEFFFEAIKKRNSRLALSFYYYLKEQFNISVNTITSLSALFAKDVSFRISCSPLKQWNFYYDKARDILSFELPSSMIKSDRYDESASHFYHTLNNLEYLNNCYVKQFNSIYWKSDDIKEEVIRVHNDFFNKGFNLDELVPKTFKAQKTNNDKFLWQIINELESFALINEQLFVKTSDQKRSSLIRYWVSQFISIAYLADYFNCWVEYIPATVGVFDLKDKNGNIFKSEQRNLGSFIVGYSKEEEISLEERAIFKLISERISLVVGGNHFTELIKEKEYQTTRAAIAQVMARNTSHNIGAHVMNKLIDRDQLETIDIASLNNYLTNIPLGTEDADKFKQIALFNNYVKCRMDYLSDIAFGVPMMHINKYAYNDIYKDLDKVRLLLQHISGLSDFRYCIKLEKNGEIIDDATKDMLLAIPNDVLGAQAFYNILENIIRNTAKHSDKTPLAEEAVEFCINFIDETKVGGYSEIFTDYVAVEINDNIKNSKIDELVKEINEKFRLSIIQNNRLRLVSLGFIEMEASAAYLRKKDVSLINSDEYKCDIAYDQSWQNNNGHKYFIKAFNKNGCLGYRFFIHKPQFVLLVLKGLSDINEQPENMETRKIELRKQGIWLFDLTDLKKKLSDGNVFSHDFLIYSENLSKKIDEITKQFNTVLPIRHLNVEDGKLKENIQNMNFKFNEWEKFCWDEWYKKLAGNGKSFLLKNSARSSEINKDNFVAILLDHLYNEDDGQPDPEKTNKLWDLYKNAPYMEALSSLAQNKMPDYHMITRDEKGSNIRKFKIYISKLNDSNFNTTKQKIIESVISKVIVIDERIQEASLNNSFMGIKYSTLYEKMNVFVPEKSLNLSTKTYNQELISNIENYIKGKIYGCNSRDFLLIHYSILERMYEKNQIVTKLNKILLDSLITVVITSGRGTPNMSEKLRFINLSSVISAFIDIRSKYVINNILHSSRKTTMI